MSLFDFEKKLTGILYERAEELGIPEECLPTYEKQIRASLRDPKRGGTFYKIPSGKKYVVTIKKAPYAVVAVFDEDGMKAGDVRSSLGGDYYIVGREALIKLVGGNSYVFPFSQEVIDKYYTGERSPISRIQLVVKKVGNDIYIQNVGKYEIEILPYDKWKEQTEGKDRNREILLGLSILLILLTPLLFSSLTSSTGFFGLSSGESLIYLIFAFIFIFVIVIIFVRKIL